MGEFCTEIPIRVMPQSSQPVCGSLIIPPFPYNPFVHLSQRPKGMEPGFWRRTGGFYHTRLLNIRDVLASALVPAGGLSLMLTW